MTSPAPPDMTLRWNEPLAVAWTLLDRRDA